MGKNLEHASDIATGKMPAKGKSSLAKRVQEVLLAFGGEAHRTLVIEQVARSLGHDVKQIPEELQVALIHTFEDTWRDERRRATYGFHLPFGEGSHRWAAKPAMLH